jgi:hypothetical protein
MVFLIAIGCRKFFNWISDEGEPIRIPRLVVIIAIALGFVPIVNYIMILILIAFIICLTCDEDLKPRENPFRIKWLNEWLLHK